MFSSFLVPYACSLVKEILQCVAGTRAYMYFLMRNWSVLAKQQKSSFLLRESLSKRRLRSRTGSPEEHLRSFCL